MIVVLIHILDHDLAIGKTMLRTYTYLPFVERSSRHGDIIPMKLAKVKAVDDSNSKDR